MIETPVLNTDAAVRGYWALGGLPWMKTPSPNHLRTIAANAPEIVLSAGGALVIVRHNPNKKCSFKNLHGVPIADMGMESKLALAWQLAERMEALTDAGGNPFDFSSLHRPLCQPDVGHVWSAWRSAAGHDLRRAIRHVVNVHRKETRPEQPTTM